MNPIRMRSRVLFPVTGRCQHCGFPPKLVPACFRPGAGGNDRAVAHVLLGHPETDEKLLGANQTDSVFKTESVCDAQLLKQRRSPYWDARVPLAGIQEG